MEMFKSGPADGKAVSADDGRDEVMGHSHELPEIKAELFGDSLWIVLIFLLALWNDPTMDKEILEKTLNDFQDKLEKENRPG